MNFVSNLLDSIPVVGHVKGVVHYAVGDSEGGNKAMYQSTRTTAVLAGGAAGCVAGPAGAAVGAMYAGLLTDGVASIAMDEPQGLVQSTRNIGEDIAAGRNPTGSIASTALQLGFDGLGGVGMGGITGAAAGISETAVSKTAENVAKKVATNVGEEVIEKSVQLSASEMTKLFGKKVTEKVAQKAVSQTTNTVLVTAHIGLKAQLATEEENLKLAKEEREKKERARRERERKEREERARQEREERARQERERQEREERERQDRQERENRGNENNQKSTSSGTTSGSSKQPRRDKDKNNSKGNSKIDYFDIFKKLLARLLKLIYGNEREAFSEIFQNLSEGQIAYLEKIIKILMKAGILDAVVELVIRIFKEHFSENTISFTNFLSLLEFVQTYILEELNERITMSGGTETAHPNTSYNDRRQAIIADILSQSGTIPRIVALFRSIQAAIRAETVEPNCISPDFRDIFAAVYHYFKHRCVPGDGILTVKQYYDWIRKLLKKLKETPQYAELLRSTGSRTCRYEIYVVMFGRRFRIIVKIQNGELVLSSGYVVTIMFPGDKEGDIFIELSKP